MEGKLKFFTLDKLHSIIHASPIHLLIDPHLLWVILVVVTAYTWVRWMDIPWIKHQSITVHHACTHIHSHIEAIYFSQSTYWHVLGKWEGTGKLRGNSTQTVTWAEDQTGHILNTSKIAKLTELQTKWQIVKEHLPSCSVIAMQQQQLKLHNLMPINWGWHYM